MSKRLLNIFLFITLLASTVHACPTCNIKAGDANLNGKRAMLISTGFLLILPPGMVAGLAIWLYENR